MVLHTTDWCCTRAEHATVSSLGKYSVPRLRGDMFCWGDDAGDDAGDAEVSHLRTFQGSQEP